MRRTYSIGKRLLALLLCVAMVAVYLPGMTMIAKAATADNTTVDPETLDQWQKYFGQLAANPNNVALTTEYAGGVWTDKSVFDPDDIPAQLTSAKYNGNGISVADNGENFLIALSAMASNKQIKGYSTIPTDTVFVLDLSSSMRYTDDNGNSAVDELVSATNQAITDLLALNKNNRVAVIVYAGNTNKSFSNGQGATQIILPLDSYTTDKTENGVGTYLQIDPLTVRQRVPGSWNQWQDVPNPNPYALAVYDGVSSATGGANAFRTNGFEVATGTFMQDGVYEAMKLLLAADPVVQEGVQAGTDRLPIMVVMTDGEPTMANHDYNGNDARTDLGTSVMHDYNGSTNGIGHRDTIAFITSLTMAFAKKTLASRYGEAPLMYTLAYGSTVLNRDEARSVLNPAQASTIQNNLWNRFLAGESVQVYSNNTTVKNSTVESEKLTAEDRMYVDKYFAASSDTAMSQAFAAIVNEIILQSKYHPTYIETDANHDGYLTFVDKIGEYMEVTDIKGIIVGDRLFSGASLASKFNAGDLGSVQSPTDLGNNFVWSVKQRLGIEDTSVAQALLASAHNHKQLYYESDSDFSHYIGWYAKASGSEFEFLDAWYEGSAVPDGATHIVKSYGFMGDTTVVSGVANTDMMYMTVRISQEIATGNSIVTWKIPAALVPTLTYEVDVELNSDGEIVDVIDLNMESGTADSPIRLVYEVALREDIYDWNLTEKVDVNYTDNKAPGYVFYTNKWSEDAEDTERNTYSHFEPSVQNERYYFTQDTQVYSNDQGTVYTGATKPSGAGYYRSYQCFEKLTDGTLRIHTHYEAITSQALESAVSDGNGGWIIPKGVVHRYYDYEITPKVTGAGLENTETMDHSDHPFVRKDGNIYYTYSTQGNNGKLVMTPATGIKLTKSLADGYANSDTFTFKIEGDIAGAQVVQLTQTGLEASRTPLNADGTVTLQAGQTVYIIGLRAGSYTVSELIATGATYQVSDVKVNGQSVTGKVAEVTLTAETVTGVEFTNDQRGYGDLIISKDVVHPFANVPQQIVDKQFRINVTFTGEDVENATFAATGIPGVTSVTTVNGTFSVLLKDGQSLRVQGLPENTAYTVEEVLDPATDIGYLMDAVNSVTSGTIDASHPAQAKVVNIYEPAPVDTTLTITGTKTVTDQGGTFDWTGESFWFKLERYDPATQTYTQVGQLAKVTVDGGRYTFDGLHFDALGTYYYKVSEVIPAEEDNLANMSYDATTGRIVIHVTDNDVDGQMEIDVRDYATGASIAPVGNVVTFTKNFVNIHTTQANRVEFTVDKNITGTQNTGVTAAGFLFGLYEDGQSTPAYTMRTVGEDGKATFHIPVVAVGEKTYTLKEIHPADEDKIPGMQYSTATYTVVIKAEADPVNAGELIPSVVITDAAGQPVTEPVFENKMVLSPDSVEFEVKKEMNGTPKTAGEFTFTLTETDGSFITPKPNGVTDTVVITGSGSKLFDRIDYTQVGTHYYVVKETAGTRGGMQYDDSEYHITVDVRVNGSALQAVTTVNKQGEGEVSEILFRNTYTVSGSTDVTITGTKTLTGRPLLNGEFHFLLTQVADAQGTAMNNPYTQTTANGPADNGTAEIVFAPITYTVPGTYYYKISEIEDASHPGVTYDGESYIVTVVVADDDNGGLAASWSVGGNRTFAFANSYKPAAVDAQIHGVKELTGRVMIDGEFEFELYETGNDFSIDGLTPIQTKTNDMHGVLSFEPLRFTEQNDYYYVVREKPGTAGGVIYDDSVYYITIQVRDNHKGKLMTTTLIEKELIGGIKFEVSSMVFYNAYRPDDTQVEFAVSKTMSGLRTDPSGFQFGLYEDLNGAPIQTVTSDADGEVAFQPITYTADDLQTGTFTYYIKEIIPSGDTKGVTYDNTVYTVVVNLTDTYTGQMEAAYTVNGNEVDGDYLFRFANSYGVEKAYLTLEGTKTLTGRDMVDGEFFFDVYEGTVKVSQGTNVGNNIVFDAIEYTAPGNHTYTVVERTAQDAVNGVYENVTYDATQYTVTVEVKDNGDGTMTATATYPDGGILFENVYTADEITVDLWVEKTVQSLGEETIGPEGFRFLLTDENGKQLGTAETDTQGKAKFTLKFQAEDVGRIIRGTVTEVDTRKTGVVYSLSKYTVEIEITRASTGELIPVIKLDGVQTQTVTMKFVNVYEPVESPVTGDNFSITLFAAMMVISSFGLTAVVVSKKREEAKQNAE